MYVDQDSAKIFERVHARDHLAELARESREASGMHLFRSHARAEARDGMTSFIASFVAVLALVAVLWVVVG